MMKRVLGWAAAAVPALNGGARLDGAVRAGFVYPGIPTAAQKTALLEWGSRMKP
jgi:hypothetical protein